MPLGNDRLISSGSRSSSGGLRCSSHNGCSLHDLLAGAPWSIHRVNWSWKQCTSFDPWSGGWCLCETHCGAFCWQSGEQWQAQRGAHCDLRKPGQFVWVVLKGSNWIVFTVHVGVVLFAIQYPIYWGSWGIIIIRDGIPIDQQVEWNDRGFWAPWSWQSENMAILVAFWDTLGAKPQRPKGPKPTWKSLAVSCCWRLSILGLRRLLSCSAFVGSLFAVVPVVALFELHDQLCDTSSTQKMRWTIPSMIWVKIILYNISQLSTPKRMLWCSYINCR